MSKSVLLNIARESIQEVLQAEESINRNELLESYPILSEVVATEVTLYLNGKARGTSRSDNPEHSMLNVPHFKIQILSLFQPLSIFTPRLSLFSTPLMVLSATETNLF